MEAMANGLPMVTTKRGALPETLSPDAGVLIDKPVHTPEYYDAFAAAIVEIMRDAQKREEMSAAGVAYAQTLGWDAVALEWEDMILSEIKKNSADLATMANHFYRRSDIYAAKECLRRLPEGSDGYEKSRWVRETIARDFAFLEAPDGFREQYEKIGATHNPAVIDWSTQESRYKVLRDWLANVFNTTPAGEFAGLGMNVLDYGCAHGGYATNLLKDLPFLRVTGVDIDMHSIEMAHTFAEKLGVADRWTGVVGNFERLRDTDIPEFKGRQYDVGLAQEVLEHVPDPGAVLLALEERVRDGGYVYLTVPYGPWEYTAYKEYPYRCHIWEFDLHDLHELLAPKDQKEADISVNSLPAGHEPLTDEPLGWWIIRYRVTPKTRGLMGKIDMDRKLWLNRPRQTVTAGIMAGGASADETLQWCLRSIQHVVDELVIVDCGLTESALKVLEMSPLNDGRIKLIPGVDPKTQGFETPRNIALGQATQDWFLWIDTDEKMLRPEMLHKYLRANIYQGYSIHQHHPAVDTYFKPDLPVRLFRNNKKLRFYGMIHEHPESELNAGPGRTIVLGDVHILHVGYPIEDGRKLKFIRNYPMLQADIKKYPERKLQKHFIMRDNMLLVSEELRQNGMRPTDRVFQLCEETVALYREHFLGKGFYSSTDPIQYYSQANEILASRDGAGVHIAFSFAADKVQARPGEHMMVRFASVEDALVEIKHRVEQARVYENKYF
jgi:2-polyprenyl-3-methyl-5-hydroxy-6-metoxy-1,4-benzoquinol methylase